MRAHKMAAQLHRQKKHQVEHSPSNSVEHPPVVHQIVEECQEERQAYQAFNNEGSLQNRVQPAAAASSASEEVSSSQRVMKLIYKQLESRQTNNSKLN